MTGSQPFRHWLRWTGMAGSQLLMRQILERPATTLNTPVYGTWKRTGNRAISVRTLYIAFDAMGEPVAITRTTGTFEFDRRLNEGEGDMFIEIFDVLDDPLDPDSVPINTLNATVTAQRITVPNGI